VGSNPTSSAKGTLPEEAFWVTEEHEKDGFPTVVQGLPTRAQREAKQRKRLVWALRNQGRHSVK
jgi:hypothetical protein